ncbi:hypothetical protein C8T65DRAFT_697971 [Cerioporus squamosus]|nr:hypothetical protein C8T65DRAFT_697971 [Cerioporus squamosus]
MSGRNNPSKNRRGKKGRSPPSSPRRNTPPVILVPATPSTPGQVPVATDDDQTPPNPTQMSPRSYAQVAALPAATLSAVVWPVAPAATSSAGSTTQTSDGTASSLLMPPTPVLEPTMVQLIDVDEPLELPPPVLPWQDVLSTGPLATGIQSPLPPSSPIYIPSSASATPTPSGGANSLRTVLWPFGAVDSQGAGSYDEFWAHFQTPIIPDANLPSALQTPSILTPRVNGTQQSVPWPMPNQLGAMGRATSQANLENVPLLPISSESHPPVASRLRKRRRGVSPASGERIRKSARKKGKARATDRPTNEAPTPPSANPWASATRPIGEGRAQERMLPPSFIPSSSLRSSNHVPYDDFGRAGSTSTSFYGRFNQSGSYPTPHGMSDPSQSSRAATSSIDVLRPTRSSSVVTTPPQAMRLGPDSSAHPRMDIDWEDAAPAGQAHLIPDPFFPPSSQDASMMTSSSRMEEGSENARRRLRDILSDPRSLDVRPGPSRTRRNEVLPEEGEWDEDQSTPTSHYYERELGALPDRRASSEVPSVPSTSSLGWSERVADETRMGRQQRREAVPSAYLGGMGSRFTEEWEDRSPRRMARDLESSRWSSPRQSYIGRDSSLYRLQGGARTRVHHAPASTATPSNRIHSLDVFDIGDDDNLPDAVRRGDSTNEGDDERPTPIPHEGDPEVHRHDPEAHFRGMSDNWVQALWAVPPNTSVTLSTYNPRGSRNYGVNRRTASDIRGRVAQATGESNFLVIAPDPAPSYRGRGPVEWAITGLSPEGVERLLRRRVWSYKSITFFPRRRTLVNPRWVLALEGFLEDNTANIERAVRSTFERPQVRQRIEQMLRANPDFSAIPMDEAFRRIIATLQISVYTLDNGTVVANVFLQSPTQSIRTWRRWIQELRELTFGSFHTAIARARRISACAGCLGVDHPSHLCPFLRLPGWNGPEMAGGPSYSMDGRERRGRQGPLPSSLLGDQQPRRQRNLPQYGPDGSQAGSSRAGGTYEGHDWEDADHERGRGRENDRARGRGRGRQNEREGRGPARRDRKDGSRPPKHGRNGYRKDERR